MKRFVQVTFYDGSKLIYNPFNLNDIPLQLFQTCRIHTSSVSRHNFVDAETYINKLLNDFRFALKCAEKMSRKGPVNISFTQDNNVTLRFKDVIRFYYHFELIEQLSIRFSNNLNHLLMAAIKKAHISEAVKLFDNYLINMDETALFILCDSVIKVFMEFANAHPINMRITSLTSILDEFDAPILNLILSTSLLFNNIQKYFRENE